MREIKFRAWNAERKIMFQVGDNYGTTDPLDCVIYFKQRQPVILMQFTGLHDKNGKEIYEGDIVSWRGNYPDKRNNTVIGVVEWQQDHETGFHIDQKSYGKKYWWDKQSMFPDRSEETSDLYFYDYDGQEFEWSFLKVIGNIYENPELVEAIV